MFSLNPRVFLLACGVRSHPFSVFPSVSIRFHPFPSVSCFRRFVSFRFQSVGIQRFISSPFRFESVSFRYVSSYLRLVVSFPAFQRFFSIRFLEILKPVRFLSIPFWYVSFRVVFALTRYVAFPDCVFVSFLFLPLIIMNIQYFLTFGGKVPGG